MKTQRQNFQLKLERMIEKFKQAKTKLKILKKERKALKLLKLMQKKQPAQKIPTAKKVPLNAISMLALTNLNLQLLVKKHSYILITILKPIHSSKQLEQKFVTKIANKIKEIRLLPK